MHMQGQQDAVTAGKVFLQVICSYKITLHGKVYFDEIDFLTVENDS